MKTRRNDPCPCGSGRKYKHCCQSADAQGDAPRAAGTTRRHVLEVAASEPVWEVDAVPIAVPIEDGAKHRPVVILIAAADLVIGSNMRDRLSGEPDALAEAIEREIVVAAREVGAFPEGLAVRFPELREPLQARLEPRGVRVEVRESLVSEHAARTLIEHMTGIAQWPPVSIADSWSAWRVPAASIRDLFAAAAEFWRRAPWKIMHDEQTPEATLPSGRIWTVGVMGNAGIEFGLSLYSRSEDVRSMAAADDPEQAMDAFRGRAISLTYGETADLAPAMRVEAKTAGWEIAGPRAFPLLMTINTPGGGVTQQEIQELAALLRAIPEFAETHAEDLELERISGVPTTLLTWADSATGLRLRYDGESAEEDIDAFDEEWESRFGDDMDIDPDDARELQQIARQVFNELGPTRDFEEFARLVTERSAHIIDRIAEEPRVELGSLSASQLSELVDADWLDDDGPVRLDRSLPIDRLSRARALHRCRTLLRYAADRGGIPLTERGNVATAAVGELLDEFGGGPNVRPDGTPRRVIETDVRPLHLSRILLELSGALVRDRQRFLVSDPGKRLLPDESAGELFALLFTTCFQQLDLDYLGGPGWPELQEQVAYTLYRLIVRQNQWSTPDELLPELVAPPAMREGPGREFGAVPALLLETRVLKLLVEFGLMEVEEDPTGRGWPEWRRYRTTPLLADFLTIRA